MGWSSKYLVSHGSSYLLNKLNHNFYDERLQLESHKSPKKTWMKSPQTTYPSCFINPLKHGWNHPKNNKNHHFFPYKIHHVTIGTYPKGFGRTAPLGKPPTHPTDLHFLELRSVVYSKLQGLEALGGMIIWFFVARLVNVEKNLPGYVYIYISWSIWGKICIYIFFLGGGKCEDTLVDIQPLKNRWLKVPRCWLIFGPFTPKDSGSIICLEVPCWKNLRKQILRHRCDAKSWKNSSSLRPFLTEFMYGVVTHSWLIFISIKNWMGPDSQRTRK